jgi:hypothetical protein
MSDNPVAVASAQIGGRARWHPEDKAAIAEARRDLRAAKLAERIREVVDAWPPLTESQREDLAAILRPTRAPDYREAG